MIYLPAHCLRSTPFPTLLLEVLVNSGLGTSKEFPAKLLKSFLLFFSFMSTRCEKLGGF